MKHISPERVLQPCPPLCIAPSELEITEVMGIPLFSMAETEAAESPSRTAICAIKFDFDVGI